jgi:hypothetical protein
MPPDSCMTALEDKRFLRRGRGGRAPPATTEIFQRSVVARASGTATGAGFLDDPDYICRGASAARFVPGDFGRSARVNGFIK